MLIVTACGTPSQMVEKEHKSAANAKKWLFNKITEHDKWAANFNIAMREELMTIRTAISELNVPVLAPGEQHYWSTRDEYSGVAFCYEIRKVQS